MPMNPTSDLSAMEAKAGKQISISHCQALLPLCVPACATAGWKLPETSGSLTTGQDCLSPTQGQMCQQCSQSRYVTPNVLDEVTIWVMRPWLGALLMYTLMIQCPSRHVQAIRIIQRPRHRHFAGHTVQQQTCCPKPPGERRQGFVLSS